MRADADPVPLTWDEVYGLWLDRERFPVEDRLWIARCLYAEWHPLFREATARCRELLMIPRTPPK